MTRSMLLASPTPADFISEHLGAHTDRLDPADQPESEGFSWLSRDDLLRDDGALLRGWHRALVEDDQMPPPAAAKYLAGWFGGWLAESVGFVFALGSAGVLVDESVRWRRHPEGWIDCVEVVDCRVAVPPDHPWSGESGVEVLADAEAVGQATVGSLTTLLTPVLAICRSLARVGWNSLWAEVADGIGMALAFTPSLPEAPLALDPLRVLLETPGAPWKSRPTLWVGDTACGPFAMGRKGGCCLLYLAPDDAPEPDDDPGVDDYRRAYLERFPLGQDTRNYCSTCSLRSIDDVEARQRFWLSHRGQTPQT
jgi:hypothetical protein